MIENPEIRKSTSFNDGISMSEILIPTVLIFMSV